MLKNPFKMRVVLLTSIYIILLIAWNFFRDTDYAFTSQKIYDFMAFYEVLVVIVPFVWFFMISKKTVRIIFIFSYLIVFIYILPFIIFTTIWSVGAFLDDSGNGWRIVHRQPIDPSQFLAIYRTPDQGALGGDHLAAAHVTPIMSGLIHRKVISSNLIREFELDRNSPIDLKIEGFHIKSPSPNELYTQ